MATATILIGILGLSLYSSREGQRWVWPNLNIIHERILPHQASLDFYFSRGLPYDGFEEYFNRDRKSFNLAVINDDGAEPIHNWLLQDGLRTYASYLASNPLRMVYHPLRDVMHLLIPDSREYQQLALSPPGWVSWVDSVI